MRSSKKYNGLSRIENLLDMFIGALLRSNESLVCESVEIYLSRDCIELSHLEALFRPCCELRRIKYAHSKYFSFNIDEGMEKELQYHLRLCS